VMPDPVMPVGPLSRLGATGPHSAHFTAHDALYRARFRYLRRGHVYRTGTVATMVEQSRPTSFDL